jgi:hypothetical protein
VKANEFTADRRRARRGDGAGAWVALNVWIFIGLCEVCFQINKDLGGRNKGWEPT